MFQSFEFLERLGYENKIKEYRWRYRIVDDEFEEVAVAVTCDAVVAVAVIDIYSKRGLPVAPNLFIALQWYGSKYNISIGQVIFWQKKYNPKFKQYEQEIEKYLALL